jgi:hypothetical protein
MTNTTSSPDERFHISAQKIAGIKDPRTDKLQNLCIGRGFSAVELHPFGHERTMHLSAEGVWRNRMPEAEIKRLMKHLGETINETLADSPKINQRIQEIRDAGYEVFLVIEAKIGFSRKNRADEELDFPATDEPVQLRITSEDAKFLKSLKISVDKTF